MSTIDLAAQGVAPRTIRVVRTEVLRRGSTGTRPGEKPWTLYKVFAEELDGTPITEELRSFDALDGEETVTQEVRMAKDGTTIESYTLKQHAKKRRANGGDGDLTARVSDLEAQVATLTRRLNALLRAADVEI